MRGLSNNYSICVVSALRFDIKKMHGDGVCRMKHPEIADSKYGKNKTSRESQIEIACAQTTSLFCSTPYITLQETVMHYSLDSSLNILPKVS